MAFYRVFGMVRCVRYQLKINCSVVEKHVTWCSNIQKLMCFWWATVEVQRNEMCQALDAHTRSILNTVIQFSYDFYWLNKWPFYYPASSQTSRTLHFLLTEEARLHTPDSTSTSQTSHFLTACDASNSLAGQMDPRLQMNIPFKTSRWQTSSTYSSATITPAPPNWFSAALSGV